MVCGQVSRFQEFACLHVDNAVRQFIAPSASLAIDSSPGYLVSPTYRYKGQARFTFTSSYTHFLPVSLHTRVRGGQGGCSATTVGHRWGIVFRYRRNSVKPLKVT